MSTPTPLKVIAESSKEKDTRALLKSKVYTDELVIALCGPIGSPLHSVAEIIKECLKDKYDYDSEPLRLSSFIQEKMDPNIL